MSSEPRMAVEFPAGKTTDGKSLRYTCPDCGHIQITPVGTSITGHHLCRRGDGLYLVHWATLYPVR